MVKRHEVVLQRVDGYARATIEESGVGEFVKYEDYKALEEGLHRQMVANKELLHSCNYWESKHKYLQYQYKALEERHNGQTAANKRLYEAAGHWHTKYCELSHNWPSDGK